MTSRIKSLSEAGQGVWLDFVDRGFLKAGGLDLLIAEDGLTGVTSNPSIFEKAIGQGQAYDDDLRAFLKAHPKASAVEAYESLAVVDIQSAADKLRPTYDRLAGKDGYVSLEVSPYLANDTDGTVEEALRLWKAVDRVNLMIKVPGTKAGVPAVRALIEAGLNINITLLFSIEAYQAVAEAYLAGLEARVAKGRPIDRIASVASFFVSRIDTQMDKKIAALEASGDPKAQDAKPLAGRIAIANAKLAYAWYEDLVAGARWRALAARGAMPQRLLWASTGVKNPDYSDVLYIETLIGPDTVNTVPPKTLDAFRDHGRVAPTLATGYDEAKAVLDKAQALGLDLPGATEALVVDGVKQFSDAADALLDAVGKKRDASLAARTA
jgi:transaldolase/glucose-6-phosphate isomerase